MREKISHIVLANLKEFNETFDKEIPIELGENIPLFGKEGVLDSLGLVSLIVMIEQSLEEELDISIILADEKAMSQKSSPFLTAGTLIGYILTILDKESHLWISQ